MYKYLINIFSCTFLHLIILFFKIIGKKHAITISSFIFKKIGPLTYLNKRAVINLKYIWPKISKNKIDRICSSMWSNLGSNFGEFIFLHNYDPLKCKDTTIKGYDYAKSLVSKNKKNKKGVIFFSAHFGNWEIGPYILNKLSLELMGIYRKSNNNCIDRLIQKYRNKNTTYVTKGDLGAKKSYLWLRKGKSLALLMDQKLNEGIPISFLGKPSNTATALAELALRMELDVVPIKFVRKKKYGHEITFLKKLELPDRKLNHKEQVKYLLTKVNSQISFWISNNPEQWLWIHRRWEKKIYF